jgi:DNA-binding XRE family transcriptional regulator
MAPGKNQKSPASKQKLFIREWRDFMGVKAPDVADALEIERESYLKKERETWRVSLGEAFVIAKQIGIHVSQLKFPPPKKGQEPPVSLDEMVEDQPRPVQDMVRAAVKGMVGR